MALGMGMKEKTLWELFPEDWSGVICREVGKPGCSACGGDIRWISQRLLPASTVLSFPPPLLEPKVTAGSNAAGI